MSIWLSGSASNSDDARSVLLVNVARDHEGSVWLATRARYDDAHPMKRLGLILVGALIAFPLGALTRNATAQMVPRLPPGGATMRHAYDAGYIHIEKADAALADALADLGASKRAQEAAWNDARLAEAQEELVVAKLKLDAIVDQVQTDERGVPLVRVRRVLVQARFSQGPSPSGD